MADCPLPSCIERSVSGKIRQRVSFSCTVCHVLSLPGISQVQAHLQSSRHVRAVECLERGDKTVNQKSSPTPHPGDSRSLPVIAGHRGRHRRQKMLLRSLSSSSATAINKLWFWNLPHYLRSKR